MVTVAITGVSGLIGRRLVAELETDDTVERIVGLDIHAPLGIPSAKLVFRTADVRRPLGDALDGVDVLVHLAFQMDPLRDEPTMRAINVDGTRNVVEHAVRAGARKVVYVSSAVVYGAHPDNDLPLTEDSPLRANPDFSYAEHKLEVERWLDEWGQQHPDVTLTILRPSIVAGPGIDNFITRLMIDAPRFPAVRSHRPPMQFVHIDDVASALAHAVRSDLPGAYNLSSEGWLSFDEITAISGRRVLEIPEEVAYSSTERLWSLGLGYSPPGIVHYWMHPWVLSVERLVASGWRPKRSNRDALAELAEDHHDRLVVGPLVARRSTLRRGALLAVAVVVLLVARRRSRRRRDARG